MIEIRSIAGRVLFAAEVDTEAEALTRAASKGVSLACAHLACAKLAGADLTRADLTDADLTDADLTDADLTDADLTGATLTGANLTRADLAGADLTGATLTGAYLTGAYLVGLDRAPKIENLDAKILAAIEAGQKLEMRDWHGPDGSCGTTHCRAGFAVALAGEAGRRLEDEFGPEIAGTLIYLRSTGHVPEFYASNEAALEDIKRCAERA